LTTQHSENLIANEGTAAKLVPCVSYRLFQNVEIHSSCLLLKYPRLAATSLFNSLRRMSLGKLLTRIIPSSLSRVNAQRTKKSYLSCNDEVPRENHFDPKRMRRGWKWTSFLLVATSDVAVRSYAVVSKMGYDIFRTSEKNRTQVIWLAAEQLPKNVVRNAWRQRRKLLWPRN